jgi:hypothetical protein
MYSDTGLTGAVGRCKVGLGLSYVDALRGKGVENAGRVKGDLRGKEFLWASIENSCPCMAAPECRNIFEVENGRTAPDFGAPSTQRENATKIYGRPSSSGYLGQCGIPSNPPASGYGRGTIAEVQDRVEVRGCEVSELICRTNRPTISKHWSWNIKGQLSGNRRRWCETVRW